MRISKVSVRFRKTAAFKAKGCCFNSYYGRLSRDVFAVLARFSDDEETKQYYTRASRYAAANRDAKRCHEIAACALRLMKHFKSVFYSEQITHITEGLNDVRFTAVLNK